MGKPSIFSREYEKRMKKRKKTTIIALIASVVVVSLVVLKFAYDPVDFNKIKQNMQAWIDSDSTEKTESTTEEVVKAEENVEPQEETKKEEPKEQFMDVALSSGKVAKAVYIENENGEKTFTNLTDIDTGVTFDISTSAKQMIVCDTNAVITLYNVDGSSKVISKDKYVSTKGTVFTKDATLASNPGYLWNSSPKFLSEQSIIFVTNRPYFGSAATKQYLWITNIQTGADTQNWNLVGQNIQINERENGKLKITIDGNVRYIGEDGNLTQ